jgi:hypothetical protein
VSALRAEVEALLAVAEQAGHDRFRPRESSRLHELGVRAVIKLPQVQPPQVICALPTTSIRRSSNQGLAAWLCKPSSSMPSGRRDKGGARRTGSRFKRPGMCAGREPAQTA